MATPQYIRVGNTLTNILDSVTGESVNYEKVDNWFDGTPMDDSKTDGVVYRKLGDEYFIRIFTNGIVNAEWFGAKGDGITDDTIALQRGLDFARIRNLTFNWGDGNYRITSSLRMKSPCITNGARLSVYNNPLIALEVNYVGSGTGDNEYMTAQEIHLPDVYNMSKINGFIGWDGFGEGIRATNVRECKIFINMIDQFAVGLHMRGANSKGNVYNTVYLGHLRNNKENLLLSREDSNAWCNENTFIGGRNSKRTQEKTNSVTRIHVFNPGINYTTANVNLTGGGGTGATAEAVVNTTIKEITGINVTNGGIGYVEGPTVNISGDGQFVFAYSSLAFSGSSQIRIEGGNNNRFIGMSLEHTPDISEYTVICNGVSNYFEHCRWESSAPTIYFGLGYNQVRYGFQSQNIIPIIASGANGNMIERTLQGTSLEGVDSSTLRLANSTGRPQLQIFPYPSGNVHAKKATAVNWAFQIINDLISLKSRDDSQPKIYFNGSNGRIYFGNGTSIVPSGLAPYLGTHNSNGTDLRVGNGNLVVDGGNLNLTSQSAKITLGNLDIYQGAGNPNGVLEGGIGDLYVDTSTSPNNGGSLYIKTSASGNTGWGVIPKIFAGTTALRPSSPVVGISYLDTTLNKPIWYNGTNWIDSTGTVV